MLPWLHDRPLSLIRAPDGVDGQRYFQKNTPSYAPNWIRTVTIPAPSANRDVAYTVCNDADTLRWLGNQAALEFHPAPVRRDRLERPDLFVVDIDPPDDAFDAAVEAALLVLEVLDDLGLTTLVKTTGGKGLHVVVPIVRHVSPEQLRHAATTARRDRHRTPPRTRDRRVPQGQTQGPRHARPVPQRPGCHARGPVLASRPSRRHGLVPRPARGASVDRAGRLHDRNGACGSWTVRRRRSGLKRRAARTSAYPRRSSADNQMTG